MSDENLIIKEKQLIKEIKIVRKIIGWDWEDIKIKQLEDRVYSLELIKKGTINSYVLLNYTFIDALLGTEIKNFFLKHIKFKVNDNLLGIVGRHDDVLDAILEELYLMQKFRIFKKISHPPKSISKKIEDVNSVRNAIAHSFLPEYSKKHNINYKKDESIYTLKGFMSFVHDVEKVYRFLN